MDDTIISNNIIAIILKKSYVCNRLWTAIWFWDIKVPTFSRQFAHRWWWGCQPYTLAALYPREDAWYSFLLEAELTLGL
jgi:hypothetical protein